MLVLCAALSSTLAGFFTHSGFVDRGRIPLGVWRALRVVAFLGMGILGIEATALFGEPSSQMFGPARLRMAAVLWLPHFVMSFTMGSLSRTRDRSSTED
ncbi:hypothetical protein GCM10007967_10390 [Xylanimonas ulmi]|uniref:Uncharacterized protein n=1 Tax=Xylanimonas ulmi TaxID=228973 RepID=A0A4Q7M2V1_9MICO|nr:hypothetical protein EV386_1930 [Xylanibacterium ulmi]